MHSGKDPEPSDEYNAYFLDKKRNQKIKSNEYTTTEGKEIANNYKKKKKIQVI